MYTSAKKGQEDHNKVAHQNKVAQQASQISSGSKATAQLVDNRAEAHRLRKIQKTVDSSFKQTSQWRGTGAGEAPQFLQLKPESEPVQRQDKQEDEELLQGKFDPVQRLDMEEEELMQGRFAGRESPAQLKDSEDVSENRTGMPDSLKAGVEQLSGLDMSAVRVHYNSDKPSEVNAHAYAQGQDIHLGPGQTKHLPHEAWHTVQQMQGRVRPTMQAHGVSINDDAGLEQEADLMGAKALQKRREY